MALPLAGCLRRFVLPVKHTFTVGRARDCDVVLADGSVSRRHAALELHSDHLVIVDCGSTGGTYLLRAAGAERLGRAVLAAGTSVRLGEVEISAEDLVAAIGDRYPGLDLPLAATPSAPGRRSEPARSPSTTTRLVRCGCGRIIRHDTPCPECGS